MKRRAILAGIAALLAPRSLIAQTPSRDGPRRLGVLMGNLADDPVGQAYAASLMQGLRALDWREGENLRIDWRSAGGDPALFDRYATQLVEIGADVLLAQSSPLRRGAAAGNQPDPHRVFDGHRSDRARV